MATEYIAAWKSGSGVRWRGLSWGEYRRFSERLAIESPIGVYIDLYRAVLIEGPMVEDAPAGIVEFVAKTMLETNPFNGQYKDIAHALQAKRSAQNYLDHAKALVAGLFRYTFEEIDTWDADTFFDRVAKAEFLAGRPIDPIDPEEAAREAQAARTSQARPPQVPKKPLTDAQKLVLQRRNER